MADSPIFVRCDQLVLWVVQASSRFPRNYRPVMGRAAQESALLVQRYLVAAARRRDKRSALQSADEALQELRILLRQCRTLELLSIGQYEHVVRLVGEVGRMLGGWRKSLAQIGAAPHHDPPLHNPPQSE